MPAASSDKRNPGDIQQNIWQRLHEAAEGCAHRRVLRLPPGLDHLRRKPEASQDSGLQQQNVPADIYTGKVS